MTRDLSEKKYPSVKKKEKFYHIKIHADAPEERQPWSELIDGEPGLNSRSTVLHSVGEGKSHLKYSIRPGLLNMIATDRDAVKFGHVLQSQKLF